MSLDAHLKKEVFSDPGKYLLLWFSDVTNEARIKQVSGKIAETPHVRIIYCSAYHQELASLKRFVFHFQNYFLN